MPKGKLAGPAVVLAVASALWAAPAANAHDACIAHGEDVGCTRGSDMIIDGCDREVDGNRVRAHYWVNDAYTYTMGAWDPNGANSGCAHDYLPFMALSHRVCEENVGCSAWLQHPH